MRPTVLCNFWMKSQTRQISKIIQAWSWTDSTHLIQTRSASRRNSCPSPETFQKACSAVNCDLVLSKLPSCIRVVLPLCLKNQCASLLESLSWTTPRKRYIIFPNSNNTGVFNSGTLLTFNVRGLVEMKSDMALHFRSSPEHFLWVTKDHLELANLHIHRRQELDSILLLCRQSAGSLLH